MYEMAIFAGGLGTRLKNTEILPKPFVDINGKSLISRIIESFYSTGLFYSFHILTCCDKDNYSSILTKELPELNVFVYNEPKRTGRTGALKYFLEKNTSIKEFFVANGDTLFSNISSVELEEGINTSFKDLPVTFLAKPDPKRNDYLSVTHVNSKEFKNMQNSGLFYISRNWLDIIVFKSKDLKDIDYYLFELNQSSISFPLNTFLYDAGTPERLKQIREEIK
tara:strand:- start:4236 stop:4904 length:669 start_codon:yes stop_codon:yes gene_type:complete